MSFQCTIVTPEQQPFDGQATQVILPGHDGSIGVLTNRAPLLVKLGAGALQIDAAGGKTSYFYVEGGVAQMLDNKLTVLTHTALTKDEIKADEVRAELAAAEAIPGTDTASLEKRATAIRRANGKLAVVAK